MSRISTASTLNGAMLLLLCSFSAGASANEHTAATADWHRQVEAAALRGDFSAQIQALTPVIEQSRAAGQERIDALRLRGEAYLATGQNLEAVNDLRVALEAARAAGEAAATAEILSSLGNAYLTSGVLIEAEEALNAAVALARQSSAAAALGASLNNLGNLHALQQRYAASLEAYGETLQLARANGDQTLYGKALVNAARVERLGGNQSKARTLAGTAIDEVSAWTDSHDKAFTLASIGRSVQSATDGDRNSEDTAIAYRALDGARATAERVGDQRVASYANGYLAALYAQTGRHEEALALSSRALFLAQAVDAPELLYLWHWQRGRVMHGQGEIAKAVDEYRAAAYNVARIRTDLVSGYRGEGSPYREVLGPLFLELADLLLQSAAGQSDPTRVESYLVDARNAVEQLKTAELQDYFLDECVAIAQSRATGLDRVAERTAVFYPILLPDRTELLLSLPGGIKQYSVPVGAEKLTDEVRRFRQLLGKRTTRQYLRNARTLYDWLMRPLLADLAANQIDTLVIVPDGPLRTIPMAALHDGEHFLIEQFALATTPGLTLTDVRPLSRTDFKVLLTGLTEGVQGFPPLPAVAGELAAIRDIIGEGNAVLLEDKAFVLGNVEEELTSRPYSIVHIASHGQFQSDTRNSFLLTYDGKMNMDRLEEYVQLRRFSDEPIELLTLSACQTAAGDDRAALGLSGIAIKAGARSALGTLWFINDEASSVLVEDFYRQLRSTQNTKAKSLQSAQLAMLQDPRYGHPSYWAPFLLIGNWL